MGKVAGVVRGNYGKSYASAIAALQRRFTNQTLCQFQIGPAMQA